MDEPARTKLSKFLSFVLRHEPGAIGITLDHQGWVEIATLLAQCKEHGKEISRSMLDEVVKTSPKQRFAISEDGLRIRASQGHSVEIELGYEAAVPPEVLFHGTDSFAWNAITSTSQPISRQRGRSESGEANRSFCGFLPARCTGMVTRFICRQTVCGLPRQCPLGISISGRYFLSQLRYRVVQPLPDGRGSDPGIRAASPSRDRQGAVAPEESGSARRVLTPLGLPRSDSNARPE